MPMRRGSGPRDESTAARRLGRALLPAPIAVYRAGLGSLLGGGFVRLPSSAAPVGCCGRQWSRWWPARATAWSSAPASVSRCGGTAHVIAQPDIDITTGSTRGPVRAALLPTEEGVARMLRYAARHTRAAKRLARLLAFPGEGRDETYRGVGGGLPFRRPCPRARRDK